MGLAISHSNKRMVVGIAAAGIAGVVLLVISASFADTLLPTAEKIESALKQLKKTQKGIQGLLDDIARYEQKRKLFRDRTSEFWLPSRDGNPENAAQGKIEQAAEKSGFVLSSIGNPRQSNFREGVSTFELTVDGKGDIEKMIMFLEYVEQIRPVMHWNMLTIRPEDQKKENTNLKLFGRLKFLTITDDTLVKTLLGADTPPVSKGAKPEKPASADDARKKSKPQTAPPPGPVKPRPAPASKVVQPLQGRII